MRAPRGADAPDPQDFAQDTREREDAPAHQGAPPSDAAPIEEPRWERVHPLTPLARFWVTLVVVVVVFFRPLVEDFLEHGMDFSVITDGVSRTAHVGGPWTLAILLGGAVLVIGGLFWSWWFTRYRVTADSVEVQEGAIFRKQKQARLDRVQGIEIAQPFLPRLLGLAELRFDVADGGKSALHLQFLTRRSAEDLRARLLRRGAAIRAEERAGAAASAPEGAGEFAAAGRTPSGADLEAPLGTTGSDRASVQGHPDQEPETEILRVPLHRVALAPLLSLGLVVGALLLGAYVLGMSLLGVGTFAAISVLVPAVLGLVGTVWSSINASARFRLSSCPDGLRIRYGLTDAHVQTIPVGRIQAVGITQPLLWRIPGWFRVTLNTAGIGEEASRSLLLPVGTGRQLLEVLPHVVEPGGSGDGRVDPQVLKNALEGSGSGGGFVVAPPAARWTDPLTRRRNGYADVAGLLLVRGGRLVRRLAVVPHARTQSLRLSQGPLARALGLATVSLHTAGGTVRTTVKNLSVADARDLAREQAARAGVARRLSQRPGRHPTSVPVAPSGPAVPPRDPRGASTEPAAEPPAGPTARNPHTDPTHTTDAAHPTDPPGAP